MRSFSRRHSLAVLTGAVVALALLPQAPASADAVTVPVSTVQEYSATTPTGVYWDLSSEFLQPDGSLVFPDESRPCGPVTWTLRRDPAGPDVTGVWLDDPSVTIPGATGSRKLAFDTPLTLEVCAHLLLRSVAAPPDITVYYGVTSSKVRADRSKLPVLAIGQPCALLATTDVGYIGPKFDIAQIYYLPAVRFDRIQIAREYFGDGDVSGLKFGDYAYYCHKSTPSGQVTGVSKGAGRGHLVFELDDEVCDDYDVCQVSFMGKTYNMHDKKLRTSMNCSSNPRTEYFTWGDYCLPVPKKPGKYPFDIFMSNGKYVERGDGWEFVCRTMFSTTRCQWEFDGDEVYSDTDRWKRTVTVTPSNVTVKKRY